MAEAQPIEDQLVGHSRRDNLPATKENPATFSRGPHLFGSHAKTRAFRRHAQSKMGVNATEGPGKFCFLYDLNHI
jgi:hypothetical protein